jgi:hypothetical protein
MPVGRMMQKGPRNRHLAAEACTTTARPPENDSSFFWVPPRSIYLHITQQIAFCMSKFEDMKARKEILILQRSKLLPTVLIRADVMRKGGLKIITMSLPCEH